MAQKQLSSSRRCYQLRRTSNIASCPGTHLKKQRVLVRSLLRNEPQYPRWGMFIKTVQADMVFVCRDTLAYLELEARRVHTAYGNSQRKTYRSGTTQLVIA